MFSTASALGELYAWILAGLFTIAPIAFVYIAERTFTMTNIHVLKVKYLDSPASYCGSRVRITSERFNESKIIPSWYDSGTGAVDTAVYWLTKECGLTVIGIAEGKGHDYVIVSDCGVPFSYWSTQGLHRPHEVAEQVLTPLCVLGRVVAVADEDPRW
jgi:hypothetical protein